MIVIFKRIDRTKAGVMRGEYLGTTVRVAQEIMGFGSRVENGEFSFAKDGELCVRWANDRELIELFYRVPLVLPIRGGGAL